MVMGMGGDARREERERRPGRRRRRKRCLCRREWEVVESRDAAALCWAVLKQVARSAH